MPLVVPGNSRETEISGEQRVEYRLGVAYGISMRKHNARLIFRRGWVTSQLQDRIATCITLTLSLTVKLTRTLNLTLQLTLTLTHLAHNYSLTMHKSNHNNFPREAERQAEDQFDPIKYMQSIGNWAGTSGEL